MNIAVRYYSRGGNTKKLAEAVASELGVTAETTDKPLPGDTDILFLGSSVYAYGVDESVKTFISGINVRVGKIYNFSTAALVKGTFPQVSRQLEKKGLKLEPEQFFCRGEFGPLHKGRPNENDLKEIRAFAKKVTG